MFCKVQHPLSMVIWEKNVSLSIHVGIQEIMSYTQIGKNQVKICWSLIYIVMFKLLVKLGIGAKI